MQNQNQHDEQPRADKERTDEEPTIGVPAPTLGRFPITLTDIAVCDVSTADENGDFPPCAE